MFFQYFFYFLILPPLILHLRLWALLMIEKGADINYTNKDGKTPLEMAIETGKLPLVELIIDKDSSKDLLF